MLVRSGLMLDICKALNFYVPDMHSYNMQFCTCPLVDGGGGRGSWERGEVYEGKGVSVFPFQQELHVNLFT